MTTKINTRSGEDSPASSGSVIIPGRITDKWIRNRTDSDLCQLCRDFDYGTVNGKRFFKEIERRLKDVIRRTECYLQNTQVSNMMPEENREI